MRQHTVIFLKEKTKIPCKKITGYETFKARSGFKREEY